MVRPKVDNPKVNKTVRVPVALQAINLTSIVSECEKMMPLVLQALQLRKKGYSEAAIRVEMDIIDRLGARAFEAVREAIIEVSGNYDEALEAYLKDDNGWVWHEHFAAGYRLRLRQLNETIHYGVMVASLAGIDRIVVAPITAEVNSGEILTINQLHADRFYPLGSVHDVVEEARQSALLLASISQSGH